MGTSYLEGRQIIQKIFYQKLALAEYLVMLFRQNLRFYLFIQAESVCTVGMSYLETRQFS